METSLKMMLDWKDNSDCFFDKPHASSYKILDSENASLGLVCECASGYTYMQMHFSKQQGVVTALVFYPGLVIANSGQEPSISF